MRVKENIGNGGRKNVEKRLEEPANAKVKILRVAYFDQLLGAACPQKLVKIIFAIFNLFLRVIHLTESR